MSAQAIAQQEKFDFVEGDEYDAPDELAGVDEVEVEQ